LERGQWREGQTDVRDLLGQGDEVVPGPLSMKANVRKVNDNLVISPLGETKESPEANT